MTNFLVVEDFLSIHVSEFREYFMITSLYLLDPNNPGNIYTCNTYLWRSQDCREDNVIWEDLGLVGDVISPSGVVSGILLLNHSFLQLLQSIQNQRYFILEIKWEDSSM